MNDAERAAQARAREPRARPRGPGPVAPTERGGQGEEAADPETAAAHRAEAMTHARAAKIHREAIELQAEHARAHEP